MKTRQEFIYGLSVLSTTFYSKISYDLKKQYLNDLGFYLIESDGYKTLGRDTVSGRIETSHLSNEHSINVAFEAYKFYAIRLYEELNSGNPEVKSYEISFKRHQEFICALNLITR